MKFGIESTTSFLSLINVRNYIHLKLKKKKKLLYTNDHQLEIQMRSKLFTRYSTKPYQMDMCETNNERTTRRARSINSHEARGVCSLSSHIFKEITYRESRVLTSDPKQCMCIACQKSAQNASSINSEVKFVNSGIKS